MTGQIDKKYTTDIAFSDSVKTVQLRLGSRGSMERLERSDSWPDKLDSDIIRWIAERDSVFLGSASSTGQPYIQHRGGTPGFITARDNTTLLIPDYRGNRQYISLGNFAENPQAFLFMIDYEARKRIKFWGEVAVEELESNHRQITFKVATWDINCSQYLPALYGKKTVHAHSSSLRAEIDKLENQVAMLKAQLANSTGSK